jgi:hypothetical protein
LDAYQCRYKDDGARYVGETTSSRTTTVPIATRTTATTATVTTTTIYDPGNVDCEVKIDLCTAACQPAKDRYGARISKREEHHTIAHELLLEDAVGSLRLLDVFKINMHVW